MPDYGLRPPPYFSSDLPHGILGHTPYGWTQGVTKSNIGDTPWNNQFSMGDFVYERLDWRKFKKQLYGSEGPGGNPANTAGFYSNPPFMGAGQMTGPNGAPSWMRGPDGGTQRILRGYLRRQHIISTEPESYVRLYFMYNPDQVQRQYLSWSDDTTADPTGALGQDSSSAPSSVPSLTTLQFTLYFDRQLEVMNIEEHPGVMVDLQTFDVLSGNLIYTGATGEESQLPVAIPQGMALPDNTDATDDRTGQYQPRVSTVATTVTAVFSPSLAVEGVLSGANATFTKFSKRMTPTTMALTITLMVQWVGKNNNQSSGADLGSGVSTNPTSYNPTKPGFVPPTTQEARNNKTISGAYAAVTWAEDNLLEDGMKGWYSNNLRNQGQPCNTTEPAYTDAASLVWRSFWAVGWTGTDQGDLLGLGSKCGEQAATVGDIYDKVLANPEHWQVLMNRQTPASSDDLVDLENIAFWREVRKGDLVIRKAGYVGKPGHVAFVYNEISSDLGASHALTILHSPSGDVAANGSIGKHQQGGLIEEISTTTVMKEWNLIVRPMPWGPTTDTRDSRDAAGAAGGSTGDAGGDTGASGAESGVLQYGQTVEAATGLAISGRSGDPIRLSPAALPAWKKWRELWGGPIPCTSGWRDPVQQQADYDAWEKGNHGWHRYAPANKSYHCKGLAVDVDDIWLNALPPSEQSRLRIAAREAGWGQSRWRVKGQGQNTPYEASCNSDNGTDIAEDWHFSVKGCG
jgi:hypothetical protein